MEIHWLFLFAIFHFIFLHHFCSSIIETEEDEDEQDKSSSVVLDSESAEGDILIIPKKRPRIEIYGKHERQIIGKGPKYLTKWLKEQRMRTRQKFVKEIGQKNGGKWVAKVPKTLGILSEGELRKLSGAREGPREAGKKHICGGERPFQVEPKPFRQMEEELELFGRANKWTSQPGRGVNRVKRQQQSGVTCKEYLFDIRRKWPQCAEIINNIRDQSNCGSCWAVAAASALTDRYCIAMAKAGKRLDAANPINYNSAADVMACSGGASDSQDACNGGYLPKAWEFFTKTGVVSGGNYSFGGCRPYPFPELAQATQDYYTFPANKCQQSCANGNGANLYAGEKYKALNYNYLYSTGWEQAMKDEIFENGTITASMVVYADFENYGGGVYTHATGEQRGGHAIRLIGYGNITCSDGTSQKYWLGANSWNTDWGLNGLFKIARGVDECKIETFGIVFGTPTLYD